MTTSTLSPNPTRVRELATDLRTGYPRSPRHPLGGFVIAARALDKCRAELAGVNGDYHYDCPLTAIFLDFAGITVADFRTFVATGADDREVDAWIRANAKQRDPLAIAKFNNLWREKRLSDLDDRLQVFMEQYIADNTPAGARITTWFDVYDAEERRITA